MHKPTYNPTPDAHKAGLDPSNGPQTFSDLDLLRFVFGRLLELMPEAEANGNYTLAVVAHRCGKLPPLEEENATLPQVSA